MFCRNCGNQVSNEALFCGQCGAQIERPSATAPQASRRRNVPALAVSFLVILLIGAAAIWIIVQSSDNEPVISEANDPADITATTRPTNSPPAPTMTPVAISAEASVLPTLLPSATTAPMSSPTLTPTPSATATSLPTATVVPTSTPSPALDPGPENLVVGFSLNDLPIEAVRFGNGPQSIIFIGGLHAGFAPATVTLAQRVMDHLTQNPELIPENLTVYVVPLANPDSPYAPGELNGRLNARRVDLNRNWDCDWVRDAQWRGNIVFGSGGDAPFSEPETQSLRDFILDKQPVSVIFWEARAENGLVSPGNCGFRSQASEALATAYGLAADYRIADFETLTNQVLNGDATNWLDQQGVPAIAVLLPQYERVDWENNLRGVVALLKR